MSEKQKYKTFESSGAKAEMEKEFSWKEKNESWNAR